MEGYFIGSGAILEAGEGSKIVGATLHAQLSGDASPDVVLVDFDGTEFAEVRQLLAVVAGYSIADFDASVASRLMAQGECTFENVVQIVAEAAGTSVVHLYAHWEPSTEMFTALESAGVTLIRHQLEDVSRAALIARHRYQAWQGGLKAA